MPHRASRHDAYGARAHWKRRRILAKGGYVFATLMAVVVVAAALAGYAKYRQLDGNIKVVNVGGLSGRTIYGAQNILILGSQERAHQRGYFGVAAGDSPLTANSDNLLLVHLDPTHTHATVLSFPGTCSSTSPAARLATG
jgi:anionic cell wall polymer biosynthesis LytR-Cps2A-Psr (LCP) family protein